MRKLIVLAVAGWMAVPVGAARRLTVAELAETLSTAVGEHRTDDQIARQVGELELTERLTAPTLDRFAARLPLQPRTALALQLLADQSEFLDPPADERISAAPPDDAAQQQMLGAARAYAVETWGRLPNFFVSRVTTRFDNSAQVLHAGEFAVRMGLHPVNASTRQITFRDGKEVADAAPAATPAASGAGAPKGSEELGLRSWGEFGPALTVVLADLASHKVTFSHWERTSGGMAAVYRYEVPRESSHYAVTYTYFDIMAYGRTQFGYSGRERTARQVGSIPKAPELQSYHETPGYHGTIAIDPASGAILRITIEAKLSSGDPLLRAATMIEYAPVTIGERKFICPVRSLAISIEPGGMSGCGSGGSTAQNGASDASEWQSRTQQCVNTLLVNETKFTGYHRLGSSARILTGDAEAKAASPDAPGAPAMADSAKAEMLAPANPAEPKAADQPAPVANADSLPPAPGPPAALPPAPAAPVIPEISLTAASSLPDAPANSPPPSDSGYSIKVTSRLVDVGVVAYDKKGRPVTDLKADEFEIYDNGHKQEIRFFNPAPSGGATPAPAIPPVTPETPEHSSFVNRAADAATPLPPLAEPAKGSTILLIDEGHIAWADLNYARGQMLKFLDTLPAGERVGLYSMSGLGFRVLTEATADHAAVAAKLKGFMPSALSLAQAQEEETRNRQQFNEVHNTSDLNSVNGNHAEVADADQPVDPQLLSMGDDPARASMIILAQVARHLSAIAGHKNLVWVSSDNVFADFRDQQVGIDKSPKQNQGFAVRVQEAMNDAHTSVYPFDVSQVEGGGITADMQHRNVELTPAAQDNATTAASAGGPGAAGGGRNMQPGRIMAEMSQDLHPIQGMVRDVATATGGRTIRRTGELAAALNGIAEDGRAIYQLSFSPQGPADDQYHAITVKLTGRKGLTLRYRAGYVFAKEPATMKDRFKDALWRPLDVSEIGVKAEVLPNGESAAIKLNIATGDLEMTQLGGRWMNKLDIFFIQRDDAGLHAHVEGETLGLRLKAATYQNLLAQGIPFEHAVALRPGMGSLRVLVVDENSGRMGTVTIPSDSMRASR